MMKEDEQQATKVAVLLPHDKLTLTCITWNLYGTLPEVSSVQALFQLPDLKDKADIIYFGTQECQRSLFASFCLESKEEWENILRESSPTHYLAASETMRGLHSGILLKKSLKDYFQLEKTSKLRAGGPCNSMGNKGAISIQFSILGQSFQFINVHLAANQQFSVQRTLTIHRIEEEMLRKDNCEVIFLGDMNYRIEISKQQYMQLHANIVNTEASLNYSSLLERDQLYLQKELRKGFLERFQEGAIRFPPTYKIGLENFVYNNTRIPGWTDRIFHRLGGKLKRKSYHCGYEILGSDHRPVYAYYTINVDENAQTFTDDHFVGVKGGDKCQLI